MMRRLACCVLLVGGATALSSAATLALLARAAAVGGRPFDTSLAALLCPGRQPPRVAYCLHGAARTLTKPQVHRSIRQHLIEAFGGAPTVLWSLDNATSLDAARSALRPQNERYSGGAAADAFEALGQGSEVSVPGPRARVWYSSQRNG